MRLRVVAVLQPMLDVAQEEIRLPKRRRHDRRQEVVRLERGERRERAAHAQVGLASAADDLQRLHDELDLADAAAPELHVRRVSATRALLADLAVDVAQAVVGVVVEVLAIHERRREPSRLGVPRSPSPRAL